jgi:transforming growth factor-beta-induced protein
MTKKLLVYGYFTFCLVASSCIPPVHPKPPDTRPLDSHHSNALEVGESLSYFIDYTDAMKRLGISNIMKDPGPYTFFIPNANAFDVFRKKNKISSLDELPDQELSQILLNHIIHGSYLVTQISTGYYPSLAFEETTHNPVDLYISTGALFEMNSQFCMGTPDIPADNGIIQSITKVIDLPNVLDHLSYNPDFSNLYQVLSRTDLDRDYYTLLSSPGPLTFFAPSDTAFSIFLHDHPEWQTVDDIPAANLISMLNYSIIPDENILLKNINNDSLITSADGSEISIKVRKNNRNEVTGYEAGETRILKSDIQATNGIIQQIDRILIP